MTAIKGLWKNDIVTILEEEHRSSFGDLLRIRIDNTNEEKVVNSAYIKILKHK